MTISEVSLHLNVPLSSNSLLSTLSNPDPLPRIRGVCPAHLGQGPQNPVASFPSTQHSAAVAGAQTLLWVLATLPSPVAPLESLCLSYFDFGALVSFPFTGVHLPLPLKDTPESAFPKPLPASPNVTRVICCNYFQSYCLSPPIRIPALREV